MIKTSKAFPVGRAGQVSLFTDYDIHLFKEGKHFHLYKKLGSHPIEHEGVSGTYFAVWAPNAKEVSVFGDFNGWDQYKDWMFLRPDGSGIWELFLPDVHKGVAYKYFIRSENGYEADKGDPYAQYWEVPPETASIVWDLDYEWEDSEWMDRRREAAGKSKPVAVYEMHLGSWKRVVEEENRYLTYRELANELPSYLKDLGYTHVEFMPVMEHPFSGSWGYQVTGYFAPSSRFGEPEDFMFLVDSLHKNGIGIILDWVPSHFPYDLHGLHYFDGTFLYEHHDPKKGYHPDWKSYIFNYGRNEVRSFLISNALFWFKRYHVDGLRVDAVASMLYLNYSRDEGEWEPNIHGGQDNLEAVSFLKELNERVYLEFPDAVMIAEESTAWPMVSRPTDVGGLGFGMKWMMGWMHDTLKYFQLDPIHRAHHQGEITFSIFYAFSENFMLPLSHDEVVHGKNPLILKMPGDEWHRFANLRALYAYMYAHPGAKLLFMGGEFGQTKEWDYEASLDWHLLDFPFHVGLTNMIRSLNRHYRAESALYELEFEEEGFEWIDYQDAVNSTISFLRKGEDDTNMVLVVCNFTPIVRHQYRLGVPVPGSWKEVFNSDDKEFGGSNMKNRHMIHSDPVPFHTRENSISITLSPLGVSFLKYMKSNEE